MAHDTPPVYVSNTRQLQGFVALKKIEQLRLCVEITENKDDRAREKTKTNFSFSSEVEASEVEASELSPETIITVGVTMLAVRRRKKRTMRLIALVLWKEKIRT
ncbi:BnaAnng28320D [Brassica napus]|uniref:(rape) hypothetical protein n=1 Tax=Brassica napus TaxID=3708 RepID=A0A078JQS8_BRANA|nr:unnamed protein product [Brassica napus]CDY68765.1 BnaAnng28320D [Brassica napus]